MKSTLQEHKGNPNYGEKALKTGATREAMQF